MASPTLPSKKLIRSLQLKVQEIEDVRAGLINSMESFVNKPINDVASVSKSGELSTERFREMSSYLDYVLSTLVEIDSQIQKPYSAGSVPISDLVDKISQKLSMEFSNSWAQRDERFTHLEMQAEKMTQDSSNLINQWEEKEKKIHTSINHLMQKTDNLSSIVTNQVNEQTKNTDSFKLKISDLESQADKNNCQFSSIACEINGLRESCDGHGYQLINLQRQIKTLEHQKLLSESLTTSLESSEQPDAESNLQAEARLQNTKSSPAAAAPIHSSKTLLPEKGNILQDPDHVMKSKAITSTVLKDNRTSSEEQNKEKGANADIDNKFNATKQKQPEIFKGNHGNQESCKTSTLLFADGLKLPEETSSVTDTQKVPTLHGPRMNQLQQPLRHQMPQITNGSCGPASSPAGPQPTQGYSTYPAMNYNNGWPKPRIPQATAPIRSPQAREKRIISITDPESGRNITDEIINNRQHPIDAEEHNKAMPAVNSRNEEISKIYTRLVADRLKRLEETSNVTDTQKCVISTPAQPGLLPRQQQMAPQPAMFYIQQYNQGNNVVIPNMYAPRYPVYQPQPSQGYAPNPALYFNNGWPNPGIPQATAPIRPPQAGEKRIISITDPESGRNVTDEMITEEQSEGSEKCSGVLPIKTVLAEGKTNISSDVTSQILETKSRSLKKAMKSQASQRTGLTNHVYKKPFLTFDNDKSKLLELRFCFKALKKPTGLPDLEIVLDEPNIGPQEQKRKTKPEFPESFFEQPAERLMGKKNTEAVIGNDRKA